MAILTSARRDNLKSTTFGLPGERKYPMPDRSHAANAKARATQEVKAGNLSESSAAQIRAKADRILSQSPGGYVPNPQMNKPHMHALSMAAATHLQRMGHISPSQSAAIHARSRQAMAAPGMSAPSVAPPPAFGSLAPPMNETV